MLAGGGYKKGFVLCGDPAHKAVGGLLELSWGDWNESINKLMKNSIGERHRGITSEARSRECLETGSLTSLTQMLLLMNWMRCYGKW